LGPNWAKFDSGMFLLNVMAGGWVVGGFRWFGSFHLL